MLRNLIARRSLFTNPGLKENSFKRSLTASGVCLYFTNNHSLSISQTVAGLVPYVIEQTSRGGERAMDMYARLFYTYILMQSIFAVSLGFSKSALFA
jgi:hypothetical protein